MGSDLLGWKTLLGIWALAEFVFAAETTAPDSQWPFWAIAGIVFVALLAATSQEKSLAHTQFKVPDAFDTMASTMIALPTTPGSQGNLMMPLQIPRSDPQVGALRQMFPDIDAETLVLMLRHHDDNLEATVATLLDLGEDDVGTNDDAAIARALQTEYDAARANVVHRSLSAAENNPVTNGTAVR